MKKITFLLTFMAFALFSQAQIETPQPSPASTVKQTVGLTDITVDYSRPSMKGRKIFGGLVPYGQVWRTGANASTDITFSEPVNFGGTDVEAGTYALYSVPGEKEWKVMLYSDASLWGAPQELDQELIVATATVPVFPMSDDSAVESFHIGFDGLTNNGADLYILWETSYVAVPIKVGTKDAVQKSIEKVMAGPSSDDYFAAARFYYEEGIDMEKAHEWVSKATEMHPNAFWKWKVQAEIEAAMGNYKQAIATAEKSMKIAEEANYQQYVDFNKENIAKWKKMK